MEVYKLCEHTISSSLKHYKMVLHSSYSHVFPNLVAQQDGSDVMNLEENVVFQPWRRISSDKVDNLLMLWYAFWLFYTKVTLLPDSIRIPSLPSDMWYKLMVTNSSPSEFPKPFSGETLCQFLTITLHVGKKLEQVYCLFYTFHFLD